jgi:radical SAM/Cys-rich protein
VLPFGERLACEGLSLTRAECATLQLNIGFHCNLTCAHCHHSAGPTRRETMSAEVIAQVIALAQRHRFSLVDITGGSPELNPHLPDLLAALAPLADQLLVRSNLTLLAGPEYDELLSLYQRAGVTLQASLPSLEELETDAQRGAGVLRASLGALAKLNALGYGRPGSGLRLNLAVNPIADVLPERQSVLEARFRERLASRWGIAFSELRTLNNVPVGRFREWLKCGGRHDAYRQLLADRFNPQSVPALMCRTLINVAWDGSVYDCDFNLAERIGLGGSRRHITDLAPDRLPGARIAVGEHCYACTAGLGFT